MTLMLTAGGALIGILSERLMTTLVGGPVSRGRAVGSGGVDDATPAAAKMLSFCWTDSPKSGVGNANTGPAGAGVEGRWTPLP